MLRSRPVFIDSQNGITLARARTSDLLELRLAGTKAANGGAGRGED
jgi:hypothetical protein